MPELPDVEVIKRNLEKQVLGKHIGEVVIDDSRVIEGVDATTLIKTISGKSINSLQRHGKQLFISLGRELWLTVHFGMTGNLLYVKNNQEKIKYEKLSLFLTKQERLVYLDQRIFGRIGLTSSPVDFVSSHDLGPDSLMVSWEQFHTILHNQKGAIKVALMDQKKIAGIGNVYADEILFQAKINPLSIPSKLSETRLHILYDKTTLVLKTAIQHNADRNSFPDTFILKNRVKASICPRCGHEISSEKIVGRTTFFCSNCQKM
jgi:formamidopyrimidine-DNA glycosylase